MRKRVAKVVKNLALVLMYSLPFLVPFDAVRNIDLQGVLLIVAGGCAWLAVILHHQNAMQRLGTLPTLLLCAFSVACIISLIINPHKTYDLLGAPYLRLGSLGLLSCIGCGLLAAQLPIRILVKWLYIGIAGLAFLSVPYALLRFHTLFRIGGVFAQADVFACFLGCGLLFGLQMLRLYPHRRRLLLASQYFLGIVLVLTETRAILLLVGLLFIVWSIQHHGFWALKRSVCYLLALVLIVLSLHHFVPSRLTNAQYASASFNYRLQLQAEALRATTHKPLWGYGAGNLADALDCKKLSGKALQTTCRQGYFFNSSHNIFIDRLLALGWLGGISFLLLVSLAIYKSLSTRGELRILGYTIILISAYYLTNVTSVTLELLLWVLLLASLSQIPAIGKLHKSF